MGELVNNEFPVGGLLPKKETAVLSYLNKYPTYDGIDTVIAILDSGIDPGAPGLQVTPDGKCKIIERFDCSGCGDVNTSTTVSPVNGFITGLTGRKIKIPNNWKNPDGTYRIGVKNAFDLYPDRLKDRMKQEYKKKFFDDNQRKSLAEVNRQLNQFDLEHTSVILTDAEKMEKEDIEAKLEILTNYDKKFNDVGPVYDCILFHDGEKWMCCIDTSDDGDVVKCPLLGEYSITHDYAPLTDLDKLNISINVHNNGNVLEIVGVCSSHGTHVASIASAYFPDSPEQNGVAPGAQIVSLTIGDGRLGSMETGTALVRAMIKIMELKKTTPVHVINMSYGEHAHWLDSGRIGELVNDIVNKCGVVWVASAGNNGPALGTISTPSDISQEPIISVGAYVSPDMMIAEYALPQKLPGTPYTWSSRGPTIDGGIGVHICAPGGAITSVPNFTLRYSQLMNGTSMASPHVAGAVSLLISGLLKKNLTYSPYIIKTALENTANFIEGIEYHAQGNGLVQIDKAFEYLLAYSNSKENKINFQIQCGSGNSKGIYLRTKLNTHTHNFKVSVEPQFLDSDNVDPNIKINFNMKFVLSCTADYVVYPSHLYLSNIARMFTVKIDTTTLPEGLHTTFINAYDVECIEKGPVFKIPITVVNPKEMPQGQNSLKFSQVSFKPNTIKRYFFAVDKMATWAVLKLLSDDDSGRFVIHTLQSLPRQSCRAMETNKIVAVSSNTPTTIGFQVRGGVVLEVVIAKYWANFGEVNLDYSITFHGVKPNQPNITMHAADGVHAVEVQTLKGEDISPSITLKNSVQVIKPSESKIAPLTSRDIIPPSRQIYELVLVYLFSLTKQCEISPNFALLSDTLYESEYESQFWLLYDSNKQFMGCGDAYHNKYSVKLEKGDYVIRLQVRHEKKDYLEKLTDAPILLQQKLSSSITMDVYLSYSQALIGGKKAGLTSSSNPNTILPLYIAPLAADKFPQKSNNPAHYLTGYITYAKDEIGKKYDTYPIKYILNDISSSKKNSSTTVTTEKSKQDEFNEAVRDVKVQWLSKMDNTTAEPMYEEFLKEYPDCVTIHSAYLQVIDPLDKRALPCLKVALAQNLNEFNKIISICNQVIDSIDEEALLVHIATKTDTRPDAAKIKSTMEQQKNILIECLSRKGIALCRCLTSTEQQTDENQMAEMSKVWKTLLKYVDPSDAKVLTTPTLYFAIWHSFVHKYYGRLLKYLFKLQEEKTNKDIEERILEFLEVLNWSHIHWHLQRALPSKFPNAYKPF